MQGNLKPTAWQTSGCPKLPSERSHRDCHPRAALSTRDRLGVPSLLHFTCKNLGSKELPWQGTILPHPWERASAQSTKYCTLLPSGSTQTIPCWLSTPPGCIPQVLCARWQRSPQGAHLLFFPLK